MKRLYIKPDMDMIVCNTENQFCDSGTTRIIQDEDGSGSQTIGDNQPNPGMDAKSFDGFETFEPWEDLNLF